MGVEARLEFGAIVRLNHTDAERQAAPDFVEELDGRPLIAGVVDLEDPDPRAIVNRRELIEAGPGAWDPLEKLHVELQPVPGLGLLVALPSLARNSALAMGRQVIESVANQGAVHRGARDLELVKSSQVCGNPARPKVMALAQVKNLGDCLARSRVR